MKNNKKILAGVLCLVLCLSVGLSGCSKTSLPDYVDVYVTTGTMSKLLARQTSLQFEEYGSEQQMNGVSLEVDTSKKGQTFYGYGCALTHSAAYLLNQDGAEETTNEILQELYGEDGARLNLVRVPIGASDYIEDDTFFSCDDLDSPYDTDYDLEHFNIDHDENIIAILKKIVEINPDVIIIACPWSAPAWMKSNYNLEGGTLREDCYEVYADYLVKFVEAYKAEGINISYLSLVNEPLITNCGYPHMMIDEYQALEVGALVNERLDAKGLNVDLLGWDHNVDDLAFDYLDTIFADDKETYNIFAGVALHGYAQTDEWGVATGTGYITENWSDKLVFMTEITEHSGSNDFASNLSYAAQYMTVDPINYGLSGMLFWNMVLQSDGSPTPVSHGNECYGVLDLDEENGEYVYFKHSAYYAMAQISKFAYAIDGEYPVALQVTSSNDSQILACALERADGTIIVTAVNISDQLSETVYLVIDGQCVGFELMPQSVVTFIC